MVLDIGTGVAVVDGEDEGVCAVDIGAASGDCGAMPGVGVADGEGGGGAVVDGEVECGDGVTACGVGGVVGGSGCALGVFCAVPDKAVAGCYRFGGEVAVADGKIEGYGGIAARGVGEGMRGGVVAGGIGVAVDPSVTIASSLDVDRAAADSRWVHGYAVVRRVTLRLFSAVLGDAVAHVVESDDETVTGGKGTDDTARNGKGVSGSDANDQSRCHDGVSP